MGWKKWLLCCTGTNDAHLRNIERSEDQNLIKIKNQPVSTSECLPAPKIKQILIDNAENENAMKSKWWIWNDQGWALVEIWIKHRLSQSTFPNCHLTYPWVCCHQVVVPVEVKVDLVFRCKINQEFAHNAYFCKRIGLIGFTPSKVTHWDGHTNMIYDLHIKNKNRKTWAKESPTRSRIASSWVREADMREKCSFF